MLPTLGSLSGVPQRRVERKEGRKSVRRQGFYFFCVVLKFVALRDVWWHDLGRSDTLEIQVKVTKKKSTCDMCV